jgi:TetR/AcrR family transcriptional repressor of nem operon
MTSRDSRELLLQAGTELFLERGYSATGLQDILERAGVPKGSFYHYFGSKEEFGLEVLARYARRAAEVAEQHLGEGGDGEQRPILERLRGYYEAQTEELTTCACRQGCLMGSLGDELANVSEAIRASVESRSHGLLARLAQALREAQEAGELSPGADPDRLADFCNASWQGALRQMKIRRSPEPLHTFLTTVFDELLPAA